MVQEAPAARVLPTGQFVEDWTKSAPSGSAMPWMASAVDCWFVNVTAFTPEVFPTTTGPQESEVGETATCCARATLDTKERRKQAQIA
jgi:hypothetical protein